jgi:site-specific recombinase XerD
MGTVRFNLRKDKTLLDKSCPIDLVYQLHGKRVCFRTKYKAFAAIWDDIKQEAVYLNKKELKKHLGDLRSDILPLQSDVDEINSNLILLRSRIKQIENRFEEDNVCYSAKNIIDKLKLDFKGKTKIDPPSDLVFKFIEKYIQDHSSTRERGSLSVYNSLRNHLLAFQREKNIEVSFQSIDYQFFQAFQNYLIENRGLSNTTVAKLLSTIKTFIGYAKTQGVIISDQYRQFKIKKEALEVIALTNDEFEHLFKMDLRLNPKFDKVRVVFCMACATGLRYSDLAQLRHEHIKQDQIILTVKKTKERLVIPLTAYSKAILEKYKDELYPLPRISNQKMNDYLKGWFKVDIDGAKMKHKGLCEIAGFSESIEIVRFKGSKRETKIYPKYELIGVHTGRKTFVTLSLEKGMSAEEVMSISGHKDYKSFKRYVSITENRKNYVMKKAWVKIE